MPGHILGGLVGALVVALPSTRCLHPYKRFRNLASSCAHQQVNAVEVSLRWCTAYSAKFMRQEQRRIILAQLFRNAQEVLWVIQPKIGRETSRTRGMTSPSRAVWARFITRDTTTGPCAIWRIQRKNRRSTKSDAYALRVQAKSIGDKLHGWIPMTWIINAFCRHAFMKRSLTREFLVNRIVRHSIDQGGFSSLVLRYCLAIVRSSIGRVEMCTKEDFRTHVRFTLTDKTCSWPDK